MSLDLSLVGRPVPRIDGPLKVTGAARYAAEYPAEGLLHGVAVQATIARGRIAAIDTSRAEAFPGVVRVYTHANRPRAAWLDRSWKDEVAPPGHPFRPLHSDRILFDGQPIALVVAESWEAARDAAALISVDWETEPPVTDLLHAVADAYDPGDHGKSPPGDRGDAEAAFAEAALRIDATYRTEPEFHNPMELFAATAIPQPDGTLLIHDKSQGAQNSHGYVCGVFGLAADKVTVRNDFVGGAFGSGLRPKHQLFFATMAALDLDRPVRVEMTRKEMFALTWRPSAIQRLRLGADRTGRLQAILHEAVSATSRYEDYHETITTWSGLAYACDNVQLDYRIAALDLPTSGDMRAPGAATGFFALETAMDELAHALAMDPLELRLRNFAHRDQNEDKPLSSKALDVCYRQGAEAFGWAGRDPGPGRMRDGRDLIGWGMATGIWEALLRPADAKVKLTIDGRATVRAAAADIGTGTYTILAQIAAEILGLPLEAVTVEIGSSDYPATQVAGGSWTAASTGTAVQLAALDIRRKLLAQAQRMTNSPLSGAKPEAVVIRRGRLVLAADPETGVDLARIFQSRGEVVIRGEGKARPETAPSHSSYTHGAVFVEVRVDEELFVPRVTRVVSAVAAGRILNPKTARSQILGGVVMGLGQALHEEAMLDHRSGRVMNHNLAEYHIPAHADVQDLEVIFVEESDDKVSPIGVKGVGEIGLVGVAAAVSNAIFHATGRRIRHLPITLDKILTAPDIA